HAQAVPHEEQGPLARVPQGKRKDPLKARQAGQPPLGVDVQYHLRIRVAVKAPSERLQFRAKLLEVVGLTVVDHRHAVHGHGLSTGFAQTDDAQPPMSERHALAYERSGGVRTSMGDSWQHSLHDRGKVTPRAGFVDAADAAHGSQFNSRMPADTAI